MSSSRTRRRGATRHRENGTRGPLRGVWVAALWAVGAACSSGGGSGEGAASQGPTPAVRGFDGSTQVRGGFSGVASSVRDSVIATPRAQIWTVLPVVFSRLGVEASTVDRASFTIGNGGSRVTRLEGSARLSQHLDCGTGVLGPNADNYDVTLQLMVQLAPARPGETLVRTTVDAYARPRSASGDPLHCASTRTLESRVMELISEEIGPMATAESGTPAAVGGGAPTAAGNAGVMAAGARAAASLPPLPAGARLPVPGDVLRVGCRAPGTGGAQVGEGEYVGAESGAVRLQLDARGNTVAVPAQHVFSVQIRERRSFARVGAIMGGVLGAAAGVWWGTRWEEKDPRYPVYHYPQAVFIGAGAVIGGLGGVVAGLLTGSLFATETWRDAPAEWAMYTSGAAAAPGLADGDASTCPRFDLVD